MLARLHQSLALRLALLHALLFTLGATALFALLYWRLATTLEAREQTLVAQRAAEFAAIYERAGPAVLRGRLAAEDTDPEVGSFFVRVLGPNGGITFAKVPPAWLEAQEKAILEPDGWGGWKPKVAQTVRIPRDARRDFAVASHRLAGGQLLQVARSTDSRAVLLEPLRSTFALAGGGILLVAVGVGLVVAWRSTAPVRLVSATARRIIATGDLAARVPSPSGSGELADLAHQFNALLDKNAALLSALRETHDNLAHDLRTPLARLRGTAELALAPDTDPAAAREALADCVEESERVLQLLETLLDVSAAESGTLRLQPEPLDLTQLARDAIDLYRETAEDAGHQVTLDAAAAVMVTGDRVRLGQVVANLLDNALKYTPAGGRVTLHARADGGRALLTVDDTGPGVPAGDREKIWRRLYRGDSSRSQRGLGLGLSVVKAIVEAHGGSVGVTEAPGGTGARFTVCLPAP